MILNELFTGGAPVKWAKSPSIWRGTFQIKTMPYMIRVMCLNPTRGLWHFEFTAEDPDVEDAYGNTGLMGRDGLVVLSTVVGAMETFLKTVKPQILTFDGMHDTKAQLYTKMVRALAGRASGLGYAVEQESRPDTPSEDGAMEFRLVRQAAPKPTMPRPTFAPAENPPTA